MNSLEIIEYLQNIDDKTFHKMIARRFRDIRIELKNEDPEHKYTQKYVAKQIKADIKMFCRTELYDAKYFVLSKNITLKLLIYYNTLGYNLEWILQPDNKNIKKFTLKYNQP